MTFLLSLRPRETLAEKSGFPFDLPVVRKLPEIAFDTPVTLLVGENGCGKSTLLEAVAAGMKAVAVGSADIVRDPTLGPARALAAELVFSRRRAPKVKLFFRAEDAFGFTKRVTDDMAALDREAEELRRELPDGSWGQRMAVGTVQGQRHALAARYGEDPDAHSHGESFLEVLKSRLRPNGLYLLDEPETPLSPTRVLALMALMRDVVDQNGQFIVATHSPLLMAFPGARILAIESGEVRETPWEEVEHVALTRAFLNNPERFLRRL